MSKKAGSLRNYEWKESPYDGFECIVPFCRGNCRAKFCMYRQQYRNFEGRSFNAR